MDQPTEDEAYKFGVQYEPPSLVYVYRDKTTRKLTRYMMPVRNFNADCDCKSVARDIKDRHENKLKSVGLDKVEIALHLLVNRMKGDNSKKNTRNRRLFHVGSKVGLPEDPLGEKLSKMSLLDAHAKNTATTDSQNEGDSS